MTNTPAIRLISLDALRGFTIALMILVNYPAVKIPFFYLTAHRLERIIPQKDIY